MMYYSNDGKISATVEGKAHGEKVLFCVSYEGRFSRMECHEVKLYEWAKHLHGNAQSGTPYGYFRASRNGKRVIVTV